MVHFVLPRLLLLRVCRFGELLFAPTCDVLLFGERGDLIAGEILRALYLLPADELLLL